MGGERGHGSLDNPCSDMVWRATQGGWNKMAFDKRGYFYRSRKVNGKVRRDYFGRDVFAEFAALLLQEAKQERAKRTETKKAHSTSLKAADGLLRALDSQLDLVASAYLAGAGFHRHERGPWIRRMGV